MDPPITKIELPKLTGNNFCPYTEPKNGRQHIWSWIGKCFPDSSSEASKHFVRLLAGIMNDACDPRDKNKMCLSDVPSPTGRQTASPYSADELAAWWNEAVDNMPGKLLEIHFPVAPVPKKQEPDEEEELSITQDNGSKIVVEIEPEDPIRGIDEIKPRRRSRRKSFDEFE